LHPDWVFCQYNYAGDQAREFANPQENMKHFLVKMQKPGWNWGTPKVRPLPKCSDKDHFDPNCVKGAYFITWTAKSNFNNIRRRPFLPLAMKAHHQNLERLC
jgi:hypothetical protein